MKRLLGFAVGLVYIAIAFGAFQKSSAGWQAGHDDLGFWWAVIATLLSIAALAALVGTWIHTRAAR
jgi:hypothetical protein